MNIVDCLAIAPYYITLFLFPDPEISVEAVQELTTPVPHAEEEEEEKWGEMGNIMQVNCKLYCKYSPEWMARRTALNCDFP